MARKLSNNTKSQCTNHIHGCRVAAIKIPIIFLDTREYIDELKAFETMAFVSPLLGKSCVSNIVMHFSC